MRIFLISNMYPSSDDPDYGVFVQNIEQALEKNGAVISEKAVISGRAISAFDKIKKYKKFYAEIFKAYRKGNFDLIYLHFISHSSPGLILAKTFFGKKKKFIVNVHGSDVLIHHKGILKNCNQKLLKQTDLLVVPSSYFKTIITEKFPDFPVQKIYVSPSGGIDAQVFYPQKKSEDETSLHLGFVSRIEDDKGWKTFLKALVILKENAIPFKTSIAGKGSKLTDLESFITQHNLKKEVDYLGILPQTDLNSLYNNLDLFIFPTYSSESLGLVGLEAMSCGTPVVGSEIAGLKTFIKNKQNGLFFTPGNEKELAEKIIFYYHLSADQKTEMKQKALQTAQNYNKDKVAKKLYQQFKKLIAQT